MAVMSKNLRPNKRGMSIVSVLVGASIGIVVITGLISMITDVFKSQRSAQSKDAQRELIMGIRHLLSDPVICAASFGGGKPTGDGFNPTQIKDGATPPNIKYQTGVNYINNLVTITRFTVRNFAIDNPANPQNGKAELVVDTKKIGATIGGEQMKGTILLLQVVLDASNNIIQCYALGSADSLWQISPVDSADIYYSSGNVGIGTTNPVTSLEISGDGTAPGSGRIVTTNTSSAADRWPGVSAVNYLGPGGSGSGHPTYFGINSRGTSTAPQSLLANDRLLVLSANGGIGGGLTNQSARIDFIATSDWTAASAPTAIYFSTTDAATAPGPVSYRERMRIDQNGNVGVGTATPEVALVVAKDDGGAIASYGRINNAIIGIENETLPHQGTYISWNETNGLGETNFSNHRGAGPEGGFNFNLFNGTGGFVSTPMAIRGNKVGIGTTVPSESLEVSGNMKVSNHIIGQFSCRTVTHEGGGPGFVSMATCDDNEFLLSGGGMCSIGGSGPCGGGGHGFLHANYPSGNTWVVDCWDTVANADSCSRAVAICCKKQ